MTPPSALRRALLCLTALSVTLPALPAAAQSARCAPRPQLLEMLEGRLGESRRAIGLTSSASVMELYASDASGRWSLVVTLPSGLSCLVGAGTGFETEIAPASGLPTRAPT